MMSNFKTIPGKGRDNDPTNPNDTIPINFAIPKDSTITGKGMPITMGLCREIVTKYYMLQKKIYETIGALNPTLETKMLKDTVDPDKEIVSGIYGRDTLMHILEQEGCEGIRYVNCIYGGEKSIVLFGVDKGGIPIDGEENFLTDNPDKNVVLYEVKGGSKTMSDINSLINNETGEDKLADNIFSILLHS